MKVREEIEKKAKRLKAGDLVRYHGEVLDVKEYVGCGIYQGNNIKNGSLVHFNIGDIVKIKRKIRK